MKTIRSTLAIEGNSLTGEQVTTLLQGRNVAGTPEHIREVRNAIAVYDDLSSISFRSLAHFLDAHARMMDGLLDDAGRLRAGDVRIVGGGQVRHVPPPASRIDGLMKDLFDVIGTDRDLHPLILGCMVHYEIELIHPFTDGNGRMGRLWQQLVFIDHHELFAHVPVEHVIHEQQAEYYVALRASDREGQSSPFVAFCLGAARDSLRAFLDDIKLTAGSPSSRLERARLHFGSREFTRKLYLQLHPSISPATASRDLGSGVASGDLVRSGDRATSRYRFIAPR